MLRVLTAIALAHGLVACDAGVHSPSATPVETGGRAGGADGGAGGLGGHAACSPGRAILGGAVVNARDLGGTPLADGGAAACGAIYRGPPLAAFDQPACDAFVELGIRTVIDLRTAEERANKPNSSCVASVANIVLAPLPVPYNVSPADYIADLNATSSMAAAFQVLGDDAAYPAYVHCTWGRDRTGVFSAIVLLALGASREAILQEYLLSQATVGAYPDSLVALLDEVDRQGGVEAYLTAAGVTADQLAALRAHGRAP